MSTDPRDQTTRTQQRTTTTTTTRPGPRGTTVRRQTTTYQPVRNISPLALVVGALILIILLFFIIPPLFRLMGIGSSSETSRVLPSPQTQRPTISFGAASTGASGQQPTALAVDTGPPPTGPSPAFSGFYDQHGGMRVLGLPLSNEITVNGRRVQWFERARLEYWPEYQGTAYQVQLGRLGSEMMQGREFQKPAPFVSQPGLFYFPQTGYAVGEPFLSFWTQYGGLDTFGYPISSAVPEQLADGRVYTVQYFERARMELHPETPDNQVQLGLLGRAMFAQNRAPEVIPTPHIIAAPGATNVPMP